MAHLPWNMKKVLRRYPFEILCGNWSLPYTGWEKPKNQIFPLAPTEISQFQNMASIKTNKIKKRMPLHYINFWIFPTLLFCPKRILHSTGHKNAICLWLSHNKEHCRLNLSRGQGKYLIFCFFSTSIWQRSIPTQNLKWVSSQYFFHISG